MVFLQILTIEDLLSGKKVDMPQTGDLRTFKKAPKVQGKEVEHPELGFKQ